MIYIPVASFKLISYYSIDLHRWFGSVQTYQTIILQVSTCPYKLEYPTIDSGTSRETPLIRNLTLADENMLSMLDYNNFYVNHHQPFIYTG